MNRSICQCPSPEPALVEHGLYSLCEKCGQYIGDVPNVLHFPDRNLLKLIDAVDGVLEGTCDPATALAQAENTMLDMGAVKDVNGEWSLPDQREAKP